MPLGKYHCDYCDKEFQDTPAARRRHLQGVHHQRAKALWYDSLRYANQVPDVGTLGKQGVCNRFVRTGSCQYGDSCKYYHPKQNVQNPNDQVPQGQISSQNVRISWGNLPPSLMPPPEGGYPPLPFIDWG